MAIPKRIPIAYLPDYYTRYIGTFGNENQFMAFVVATLPKGRLTADWKKHKRWYAVLHTFDATGNHLATDAWFAGVTAHGENAVAEKAQAKRLVMLAGLGEYKLCDIEVKLFSVGVDGHVFGLVDESLPEEGFADRVILWPNDFVFRPPWNGWYDT
jgi:hypothetical protein